MMQLVWIAALLLLLPSTARAFEGEPWGLDDGLSCCTAYDFNVEGNAGEPCCNWRGWPCKVNTFGDTEYQVCPVVCVDPQPITAFAGYAKVKGEAKYVLISIEPYACGSALFVTQGGLFS
jgi:hypothetical protein